MTGEGYIPGQPWGICPRCSFKKRLHTFRREWTGVEVCDTCWDPRHPQMDVKGVPDQQAVRNPAPRPPDIFVEPGDITADDL